MTTLAFIAAIVKALAWPVAAVVIAVIFRSQIGALLARIRKGKIGPAEFEFEQEVQALAEQIPAQLQEQQVGTPTVSLATSNPRAAILEAWLGVEGALRLLALNRGLLSPREQRNPVSLVRTIQSEGALQPEDVALFNDLRVLRNQATHDSGFSPSAESVIKYVQLASGLRARFEAVANER